MLKDLVTREASLVSSHEAVAYHPCTDTPEGDLGGLNPMINGDVMTRAGALNATLRATRNVHQIWVDHVVTGAGIAFKGPFAIATLRP